MSDTWQAFAQMNGFNQLILICATYYLLKAVLWLLPNRILRTVKVAVRGWPPEHLDADGDWKPVPKDTP
jgi:hypothetical protein